MPGPNPEADKVTTSVLNVADDLVASLRSSQSNLTDLAAVRADVTRLSRLLALLPNAPALDASVNQRLAPAVDAIIAGDVSRNALAAVLAELYTLAPDVDTQMDLWITAHAATAPDKDAADALVAALIDRVKLVLPRRPDVTAVMDDLVAMRELRGGPADATAFHDFHALQLAFKHVWLHAFDESLKTSVTELYDMIVKTEPDSDVVFPPLDAMHDVQQLKEFLRDVRGSLANSPDETIPQEVLQAFPTSSVVWGELSGGQRFVVYLSALLVNNAEAPQAERDKAARTAQEIFKAPDGPGDRLSKLMLEIGRALNEPYAFDVFAPDSYNYGLLNTYRQRWEPGAYQAGNLVATVPLAPGEVRKVSSRTVVKTSRAEREIEKSMRSHSSQSSATGRAEREIMNRTTSATNFKMTSSGSFNIGIGSISTTSEFGGNQEQFSSQAKRDFHETTVKAAEEYRLERSIEVNSSSADETDVTSTREISNPNSEITVTYLFYELQRRFRIHEFLYRVRPVILVAQDVPAPHEIDEGWLVQHQWILSRVLLDDSFRPALAYLTSGFAGDEVSTSVVQAAWEKQRSLVSRLEALVDDQMANRNALRERIVTQTLRKDQIDNALDGLSLLSTLTEGPLNGDFTFSNVFKADASSEDIEANRRAAETRLKYTEEALADAQEKLKGASDAFESATKTYTSALQNQFNRHVAIDQLRVHVKQNILFYMQAIWDHEPPDQRFFRLYRKKVICPQADPNCRPEVVGTRVQGINPRATYMVGGGPKLAATMAASQWYALDVDKICAPSGDLGGAEHELVEVADLDDVLGYKGNYMIFPLKRACPLTDYMIADYIDSYLELVDADRSAEFNPEEFDARWKAASSQQARDDLRAELRAYVTAVRQTTEEIIVPTAQLFIEALPGSHPLLEDFKLLHRAEDVLKVKAEVQHAELENLRLAARLAAGERQDPDIDKQINVTGAGGLLGVGTS